MRVVLALLAALTTQTFAQPPERVGDVRGGWLTEQCVQVVTGLLQYGDHLAFNLDWLFYLSGDFDADKYQHRDFVNNILLQSKVPYGIPAQGTDLRSRATLALCARTLDSFRAPWRRDTRLGHLDTGPYSPLGLAHYSRLRTLLRQYDVINSKYVTASTACAGHLEKLLRELRQKDVDVDALLVHSIGFNPHFSHAQWCTLGLNFALARSRQARKQYSNKNNNSSSNNNNSSSNNTDDNHNNNDNNSSSSNNSSSNNSHNRGNNDIHDSGIDDDNYAHNGNNSNNGTSDNNGNNGNSDVNGHNGNSDNNDGNNDNSDGNSDNSGNNSSSLLFDFSIQFPEVDMEADTQLILEYYALEASSAWGLCPVNKCHS